MSSIAARDISGALISEESIREKLPSIFKDSIFLDTSFNITVISQNLLDLLEFSDQELSGKSLNYIAGNVDIVSSLTNLLRHGYFDDQQFCFYSKSNQDVSVKVSGFYLGLISDISQRIVLVVRQLTNDQDLLPKLQTKQREVDNFIYRVSHDLRGPLATIKGLINLMKMRESKDDVDNLVQLIDAHANQLDERLFQLVYLTNSSQATERESNHLNFSWLETRLRRIVEKNAFIDFFELQFNSPGNTLNGVNGSKVVLLLENLLLHILSSSLKQMNVHVFFDLSKNDDELKIIIGVNGFEINEYFLVKHNSVFTYTDLISYPSMTNYFSAQKIAEQLSAKLKVRIFKGDKQRIEIRVPILH